MRPAKRSDSELLAWAAGLIARAQEEGAFCKIVIHIEGGRIVRGTTEKSERPDDEPGRAELRAVSG